MLNGGAKGVSQKNHMIFGECLRPQQQQQTQPDLSCVPNILL